MERHMATVVNHAGQCVRDLARTQRFYEEVLGFEFWRRVEPPEEMTAQRSWTSRDR